jgi:hypothetical protein
MQVARKLALTIALIFTVGSSAAGPVKLTKSGICHPEQSSYYDRINSYMAFTTVDSCLEYGGRLPERLKDALDSTGKGEGGYDRSKFGHGWADLDSDGQDARAEALIEQSTGPVSFAGPGKERVVHGRWISPFTGNIHTNASDLDADHVVALRFAWDHGASAWSESKRRTFANDPRNIWIVEASLNRQKQAKDIAEWLPPKGQCLYIARFFRLTKVYDLQIPQSKQAQYQSLVDQCTG